MVTRIIKYQKIARAIEDQISKGTLKIGDKLPSIRVVQKIYQVSMNTVKQAYLELERKSLIEARAKSGFYVCNTFRNRLPIPDITRMKLQAGEKSPEDLIDKVFDTLKDKRIIQFSLGVPDHGLLPVAKLNKGVIKVMRSITESGAGYEPVQGSLALRRNISKWTFVWGGQLTADDLITTSGAMNAIFNCLMAVTKPGDTIGLESPVYFGILQIAKSLGLKIIELPTHPVTGIELDALSKVLHKLKACCLISNFNNPLGSCMPETHKQALVAMLTKHNIPLIEDDLYGDLYFGASRPRPCKVFDESGLILWCGSFSKSLAPGYRVGWVAPGKFKEKILRQKLLQTISTPSLYQEVIADFMEHGRYDHHLRTLRQKLYTNCLQFQRAIHDYFPADTRVTQPQGGFMLWLELNKRIDTSALFDTAIRQKISFAPGRMFTQHNQFNNCLRLNFASNWSETIDFSLKRLGKMVKDEL